MAILGSVDCTAKFCPLELQIISSVVTDDVASESRVDQRILTAHYKIITEDGESVDNVLHRTRMYKSRVGARG